MGDEAVILFAAVGLIALGLYFIFAKKGSRQSDDRMVEATVVDFATERRSTNSDHPGQSTTASTYPVYEYTVDGKTYRTQGSVGITIFSKKKYQPGAKEMVRVDPEKPERIHTDGEKNAMRLMGVLLVGFGLVTLLIAL